MKRILISDENSSGLWWQVALRPCPPEMIADVLHTGGELVVEDDQAAEILAWAESLPGWGEPDVPLPIMMEHVE